MIVATSMYVTIMTTTII